MSKKGIFHLPMRAGAGTCLATFLLIGLFSGEAMAVVYSHKTCNTKIDALLANYYGCASKPNDLEIANCLKEALKNHPECFDEIDRLLAGGKLKRKESAPPPAK